MSKLKQFESIPNEAAQNIVATSRENDLKSQFDEAKLEEYKQGTKLRKQTFVCVLVLVVVYLAVVLVIVIYVGKGCLILDSSVLIALLTTTTANIVGLFLIVIKGLFRVK